jgi:predicted transcriptional regulator
MNVSQLMSRNVETCRPEDTPLAGAARKMWERDIGCLAVIDADGRVVGMITDRDICMAGYTQGRPQHEIQVAAAMSKELFSCTPNGGSSRPRTR